jgi:hypothetical protein
MGVLDRCPSLFVDFVRLCLVFFQREDEMGCIEAEFFDDFFGLFSKDQ